MKRHIIIALVVNFLCLWFLLLWVSHHYANHGHPQIIIEREKVCDCSDELRDVSQDLKVYKNIAQDMRSVGQKMFSGLDLVNKWIKADKEHEAEQAEQIQKAQKTADEALRRTRGCR